MSKRPSARLLLARAGDLLDATDSALALAATTAWRRGFASGGDWMALAMQTVRQEPTLRSSANLQALGLAKYVMACAAGMLFVLAAGATHRPLIALSGIVAFYAVEAQLVFLFPLALDGRARLFRESRRWTLRAGGTFTVMRVILPLAATMIFGGFFGRGFVRSWCLGCLAVCIWYEDLRLDDTTNDATIRKRPGIFSRLQFGATGPLHLRNERVELGLSVPIKLLYASDLHLGWRWTNPIVAQLLAAVRSSAPDAIILGGDLADRRKALTALGDCIAELVKIAPVYAIAGNHDDLLGVDDVRAAVQTGGATWMAHGPCDASIKLRPDLHLCSAMKVSTATSPHRVLCAHNPAIFPAACSAGYRLVLAGHLHGGQCVLFNRGGRLYPGTWFARWTGLRFTEGQSTMLVSRGAADMFPIRWNCPREVIVCEIV